MRGSFSTSRGGQRRREHNTTKETTNRASKGRQAGGGILLTTSRARGKRKKEKVFFFSPVVCVWYGVLNDSFIITRAHLRTRLRPPDEPMGRDRPHPRRSPSRRARDVFSCARAFKERDLSKPPTSSLTLYCTVRTCTVILTRTCTLSSRVSDRPDRSVGTHNNNF